VKATPIITMPADSAGVDVPPVAASSARAWAVLVTLCFVYVLNFLDRSLISILAKPIQDSLHVSDGQLGLLGGLFFALFYCFIAIPVGWVADKTNRVWVLTVACTIWSGATMACGVAANFSQLAIARMTVGFGEAGGVPPSYAIISDYFPSGRRGAALSIYNLGPPIGAALGIAFGASIAAAYSWREAFIVLGAIGLVAAVLVRLIVREPERGGLDRPANKAHRDGRVRLLSDDQDVLFAAFACARRRRQWRHADHHLRLGKFHDASPHAGERDDARRSRGLVRAGRRHRHERGHLCFRMGD
jgi:MFS family permease